MGMGVHKFYSWAILGQQSEKKLGMILKLPFVDKICQNSAHVRWKEPNEIAQIK